MRLTRLNLILPVLLAACMMPVARTVPQAVRLNAEELTLTLSDATICRAAWRAAPEGRLEACGAGYGYFVRLEESRNVLRLLAEGLDMALGGGLVAPMAEVVITDASGRDYHFTSPAPFTDATR